MASSEYRVQVKRSALKELEAISTKKDRQRITARIGQLAGEPRPPGCEKLSSQQRYRVRQGDYRIVYAVDDAERLVSVVKIGQRKDVYR